MPVRLFIETKNLTIIGFIIKDFIFIEIWCFIVLQLVVKVLNAVINLVLESTELELGTHIFVALVRVDSDHDLRDLSSIWHNFGSNFRFVVIWLSVQFLTNVVDLSDFWNSFLKSSINFFELVNLFLLKHLRFHLSFKFLSSLSLLRL